MTDNATLNSNLTVAGAFNQIPTTWNMPQANIVGGSNFVTFAHGVVPNGTTQTINFVQSILANGTTPGSNQIVRIFDATASTTLLATNGNWNGTLTITNGTRWYARFENNSTTNIQATASVHGHIQ